MNAPMVHDKSQDKPLLVVTCISPGDPVVLDFYVNGTKTESVSMDWTQAYVLAGNLIKAGERSRV